MTEPAEKIPFGGDLTHPVTRSIFGLAGVIFLVVTVIEIKDGSSIGSIVQPAAIALAGLAAAVFARALTERSRRKYKGLPGWPDNVIQSPLKQLFASLWIFGLMGAVFFLDLLLARPLATSAVVLAGAVSIFLWIYVGALLHGRFRKFVDGILASPFAFGFLYAFGWVFHANARLTEPDATFDWAVVVSGGIGLIVVTFSPAFRTAKTTDTTAEEVETPPEEAPDVPGDPAADSAE